MLRLSQLRLENNLNKVSLMLQMKKLNSKMLMLTDKRLLENLKLLRMRLRISRVPLTQSNKRKKPMKLDAITIDKKQKSTKREKLMLKRKSDLKLNPTN
jgi:hypothetical protein